MREPKLHARHALYSLVLLLVALAVAGCAGVTAPVPTPAPQASTPAPAEQAATAPGTAQAIPAGVDAEGNFYRGDPNAAVKLTEWSDFQ